MRVHAVWRPAREPPLWIWMLGGVEWLFLLFGLAAIDLFIWLNTSSMVYEAYEDWAFDQDLRGLAPSPMRFTGEEIRLLFVRERTPWKAPGPAAPLPSHAPSAQARSADAMPPAGSATIGRLEIPNLHLTVMVQEGADAGTLRRAVGHIPCTALPGRRGNVGLAGHRDTFFRRLREIHVNDAIELQTKNCTYRYLVESMKIVGPRDVHVLASTGSESLTLVTCYPFYYVGSAPKRFIVHAALKSGAVTN
jgi:sortase A